MLSVVGPETTVNLLQTACLDTIWGGGGNTTICNINRKKYLKSEKQNSMIGHHPVSFFGCQIDFGSFGS